MTERPAMPAERTEAERRAPEMDADTCIDIAAEIIDARDAEIARLQQERDDYRGDSIRLHKDKCDALDRIRELEQERNAATRELAEARQQWSSFLNDAEAAAVMRKTELDAATREAGALRELLTRASDKLCHYATDYPQPDALSIINDCDRALARGHYSSGQPAPDSASMAPGPLPDITGGSVYDENDPLVDLALSATTEIVALGKAGKAGLAWPVAYKALTAAHARGFDAAYARYVKDHRVLVEIMYRERGAAKLAARAQGIAQGRAEMREGCALAHDQTAAECRQTALALRGIDPEGAKENLWRAEFHETAAAAIRALPDAAIPEDGADAADVTTTPAYPVPRDPS